MPEPEKTWSSSDKAKFGLEIAKLLIGIWVAWWLWYLGSSATRVNEDQARLDAQVKAVVDQRLKLWENIAPKMNEIYCYFLEVGDWKALDGKMILDTKRELDAEMYSNQIMWDPEFFKTYERFMKATFHTYRGPGLNAALRTTRQGRPEGPIEGIDFEDQNMNTPEVFDAYWAFEKDAARELHVDIPQLPDRNETLRIK